MRRFMNDMLFPLFCKYRRKDDADMACFYSKLIIGIILSCYLSSIAILLSGFFHLFFLPKHNRFLTFAVFILPAILIAFSLTKNWKYFEEKLTLEGDTYVRDSW